MVFNLYDVMPSILCEHLFCKTLSLLNFLLLVLIILFAQYEKTLITKLLYSISDVFVLVYLVILFNMFILWFTLDIILLTLGVWSSPLVMSFPSIFSLSDCFIMYLPACIIMSLVSCLCVGLYVMMNLVYQGWFLESLYCSNILVVCNSCLSMFVGL